MWCKDKDRYFVQIRIEPVFFLLDLAHRSYFFRINTVLLAREDERYYILRGRVMRMNENNEKNLYVDIASYT